MPNQHTTETEVRDEMCEYWYQKGLEKGIQKALEVAQEAKATFFGEVDEKTDSVVGEACYEMKAEIVDGIALLLADNKPQDNA